VNLIRPLPVAVLLLAAGLPLAAQSAATRDTVHLDVLQRAAESTDRRAPQLELLAEQSRLRLRSIGVERLPAFSLTGLGQYLSDVPSVGALVPGGTPPPVQPNDQWDANLGVRQRLYDPARAPRRAVEEATLAESRARVRSALYQQRQLVSEAFFAALLLDAQRETLEAGITDLEAQRRVAGERVAGGAGLPSETALLDAELLRRRQSLRSLEADRDAAREVLATLGGRAIPADAVLALPDAAGAVAEARVALDTLRGRPEFEQFARGRALIAERRAAAAAQDAPRVTAFGRTGYGRPGLNPLARDLDTYWMAGVQVEWSPFNWGATRREQEVQAVQARILASEEAAFAENLRRAVIRDLATVDQLERALRDDDEIIALHERVLRETRLRYGEGVITSAEYVDRETDVLTAQLARATRRVRLAEARARFLTTIGREVR
jgi:outer membrane protein TolC